MKTRPPAEFATTKRAVSRCDETVQRISIEPIVLRRWRKPTTSGRHAGLDKLGDKALRRHTSQLKHESGRRDNR